MRKLVLILITLLAVVTFVRTKDNSLTAGELNMQNVDNVSKIELKR
ncbi:MAG: hypothetical protein Ta2G_04810 [Termitinemataceae bacterium]|nr:MAG: hypothetical protein Ta2G_04810 [Termitinemataceae bacterium]